MRRCLIAAAAVTATLALTAPAHAVERGQCLPNAEMVARLRDEGQRALVQGVILNQSNGNWVASLIVTANADGSRGYELRGQFVATQRTPPILCVQEELSDVRLNDARAARVAESFYLPVVRTQAEILEIARGTEFARWNPRVHNQALQADAARGSYPMVRATFRASGRTVRLTVSGNPTTRRGTQNWSDADWGMIATLHTLEEVTYTPYALELLGSRQTWP